MKLENLRFRSPNGNLHSDIPRQGAHSSHITMQPLLQIAIVNIFIHKHPKWPVEIHMDELEGKRWNLLFKLTL